MNEDLATKAWADHHDQLSGGMAKAIRAVMDTMNVLNEQQFGAPWRKNGACRKSAKC